MTNFRWSRVFAACIVALMFSAPAHASAMHWLTWIDGLSGPGPFDGYLFSGEFLCLGFNRPTGKLKKSIDALQQSRDKIHQFDAATMRAMSPEQLAALLEGARDLADALDNKSAKYWNPLCISSRENEIVAFALEIGKWDDKSEHDQMYTGLTKLSTVQLLAYFPLRRVIGSKLAPDAWGRAIELGSGFGTFRFTGNTVRRRDLWKGTIPVRARIMPSEFFYREESSSDRPPRRPSARVIFQALQFRFGFDYFPTASDWDKDFKDASGASAFSGTPKHEVNWTYGIQLDLGRLAWSLFPK